MNPLYRRDGRYVGFRVGDHVYTSAGKPFGWVDDDNHVWRADGEYLGDLFEESYVLRGSKAPRRTRRRMHPARPMPPLEHPHRGPRHAHPMLDDGLAWLGNGDEASAAVGPAQG